MIETFPSYHAMREYVMAKSLIIKSKCDDKALIVISKCYDKVKNYDISKCDDKVTNYVVYMW